MYSVDLQKLKDMLSNIQNKDANELTRFQHSIRQQIDANLRVQLEKDENGEITQHNREDQLERLKRGFVGSLVIGNLQNTELAQQFSQQSDSKEELNRLQQVLNNQLGLKQVNALLQAGFYQDLYELGYYFLNGTAFDAAASVCRDSTDTDREDRLDVESANKNDQTPQVKLTTQSGSYYIHFSRINWYSKSKYNYDYTSQLNDYFINIPGTVRLEVSLNADGWYVTSLQASNQLLKRLLEGDTCLLHYYDLAKKASEVAKQEQNQQITAESCEQKLDQLAKLAVTNQPMRVGFKIAGMFSAVTASVALITSTILTGGSNLLLAGSIVATATAAISCAYLAYNIHQIEQEQINTKSNLTQQLNLTRQLQGYSPLFTAHEANDEMSLLSIHKSINKT